MLRRNSHGSASAGSVDWRRTTEADSATAPPALAACTDASTTSHIAIAESVNGSSATWMEIVSDQAWLGN